MPTPPIPLKEAKRRIEAVNEALRKGYRPPGISGNGPGAIAVAADSVGLNRKTFLTSLDSIKLSHQIEPDWSLWASPQASAAPIPAAPAPQAGNRDDLLSMLRKGPARLDEIAGRLNISKGQALVMIEAAQAEGLNIVEVAERWSLEKTPESARTVSGDLEYPSSPGHKFKFGCTTDNHLCSKYERLDVLSDLYDRFAAAGIERVYNAGNWIDGEAPFNKFDLKVHGLEPQLRYLAKHYPQRPGITTYAIAGEDHEGWLGRREAIDIGRFTERIMREQGREDWRNLGFMESYVPLVNSETGKRSMMLVMHPGGGSSYATSYRPQKIVESFEGGEKPAVLLIGHYHKLSVNLVRNVWALQIGCTQDQTVFMRKKNIDAHIGGMIVELEQDPETGAIIGCKTEIIRYFNVGYYQNRWSPSEEVTLPKRTAFGL